MKYILGFLFLLLLILIHESGHFIFAKLFGVKVETFSVGFGPALLKKTIKGTEYRLSLIPLGGYCGMKGENEFRKAIEENLTEIPAEPDSLYGVHPVKRALIGFAGPLFNLLTAIIFCSLIAGIGYEYQTYTNQIIVPDESVLSSSPARDAGIQTGDIILKVQNTKINNFNDLIWNISTKGDKDLLITVDRDSQILEFNVHTGLNKTEGRGLLGVQADTSKIITEHTPKYNFFVAIAHGTKDTFNYIGVTFKGISLLFKGIDIKNNVQGPVRVTELLGNTIHEGFSQDLKSGFISLMELLSLISISLFIMNLLPVPVLDGGLILIALIEAISRKKIKPKIQYYVQFIGVAFILFLFIISMSSDISYFISKGKVK